jgi:hypothetical protein
MKVLVLASAALVGSGFGITNYLSESIDVNQSIQAAREGIVVVRIPGGEINIEGWDRNEVQVTGTIPSGEDRFHLSSDHGHVEVQIIPDLSADPAETNITIMVPERSSLDVETDAAGVVVDGVTGVVRMATGSGNIKVDGNPMGIVARSQSGDIDITAERTPGIAHSEEGTVKLRGGTQDFVADRTSRRMENRIRNMECQHRDSDDCEHDQQDDRRRQRNSQNSQNWKELGLEIGSIVQSALEEVDFHLDFEDYGDGFRFDMSGDIDLDEEKLEEMFEDMEDFFVDFGDEIGETMVELSEDLERMGEDLKDSHRKSRRGRI